MTSGSGILWPRHEVLQLINPAIPQAGKSLSQGLAIEAIRQLAKMQSPDGSISFQQWYSVSRDLLKWNDHFVRLFWDMLHIAMWYRQKSEWSQHSDFVQFGYLVVFLIMHVTTHPRPSSPSGHFHFDSIWPPLNANMDSSSASSSNSGGVLSPPTSPVSSHRKHMGGGHSVPAAPLSPRQSPRSPRDRAGSPGASTSPRKQLSPRLNTAATFVRSHAQHLSVLREKVPLLLYALSFQDSVTAEHREEMALSNRDRDSESSGSHKRSAPHSEGECSGNSRGNRREDSPLFLATMSSNAFDALGLLMGGGDTKQQEISLLSFLFVRREDINVSEVHTPPRPIGSSTSSPSSTSSSPSSSNASSLLRCAHAADWIDSHLQLNDVLYPPSPVFGSTVSPSSGGSSPRSPGADIGVIHHPNSITEFSSPTSSPSSSSHGGGGGNGSISGDSNHHSITIPALQSGLPIRQVINIDSPQCREPTVIHGTGCTAFHILKVHGNGHGSSEDLNIETQSSLKSLGHMDDEDSELVLLEEHDEEMSSVRQHKGRRNDRAGELTCGQSSNLLVPERYGPVLLNNCSRTNLYLLSPYTFASVSSCSDSEIVLGAVGGVVVMSGCERVQITVACRKLILWNCKDCDIKVATLTPTIVSGDCRGLTFGPFNTSYRHLRTHLRLAHLEALIVASKSTLANVDSNCWNEIYDVNSCADLDSPTPRDRSNSDEGGPGGDLFSLHNKNFSSINNNNSYSHHNHSNFQLHAYPTMTSGLTSLPPPPDSVLTILNPEKYAFLPIPYTAEFQPQEMCPTMTPEAYLEAYMRKKQASVIVREGIQASLHQQKVDKDIDCASTFDRMLSHQFLEWLAKTGKAPGLLDLIRLDAEEKSIHNSEQEESTDSSGGFGGNSNASAMMSKNSW